MVIHGHCDEIPWGDVFFTLVVDLSGAPSNREIERVLALGPRRLQGEP